MTYNLKQTDCYCVAFPLTPSDYKFKLGIFCPVVRAPVELRLDENNLVIGCIGLSLKDEETQNTCFCCRDSCFVGTIQKPDVPKRNWLFGLEPVVTVKPMVVKQFSLTDFGGPQK